MKAPAAPAARREAFPVARRNAASKGEDSEPLARFVAYAPEHLTAPSAELDAWFRRHLPRGIDRAEAAVPVAPEPDRLNRDYARTLSVIGGARLPMGVAIRLAHALRREGERARRWRDAGCPDRYAKQRAADAAFIEKLESVRTAALRLAQHFEDLGASSGFALAAAALRLREKGVRIVASMDADGSVDIPAELARFLRLYAETIESHHDAKRGPMFHRWAAPPFIFQAPIDASPPWGDPIKRGLLWKATWHARRLTGGTGSRSIGAPMFEGGKPLWNVAAALVQDVTGEHCDAEAAQDALSTFIRRNPGVGFYKWPDPNPDT